MDLNALYQSIILDHNRRPRNFREMLDADRRAAGQNPLCGDEMTLWVKLRDDRIEDVSFVGTGCAISKASASIMTTAVKGKTQPEAVALFERFHDLVTRGPSAQPDDPSLGSLAAFSGVSRFPVRVKCASLPWHALRAALRGDASTVTTERS
jgi:nitrogen fixation NifU-like protein